MICPKCGGIVEYSSYFHAYICTRGDCEFWQAKLPTNADLIRQMSDEELADFFYRDPFHAYMKTPKENLEWLRQESVRR